MRILRSVLAVGCGLVALGAEPKIALLKQRTVYVAQVYQTETQRGVGHGSGFAVDDRHIVTNWHVCCNAPAGARVALGVPVGTRREDIIGARAVWSSPQKDLAVLQLERPLGRPVSVLSARKYLEEIQPVIAVGFPGASPTDGGMQAAIDPTITTGIISKFLPIRNGPQMAPVQVIQTTAPINPGNSGGPLFNACGEVVGINVAKTTSTIHGPDGRPITVAAEGINLSILVDELGPELDRLGIRYQRAAGACVSEGAGASGSSGWMAAGQAVTAVAAVGALVVAFRRRSRQQQKTTMLRRDGMPGAAAGPVVRGVAGAYQGQTMGLSARPLVFGRDPGQVQVVVAGEAVSKRHCQLRWEAASGRVFLDDLGSSNGTWVGGQRMAAGGTVELQPGSRFYLGGPEHQFEVAAGRS